MAAEALTCSLPASPSQCISQSMSPMPANRGGACARQTQPPADCPPLKSAVWMPVGSCVVLFLLHKNGRINPVRPAVRGGPSDQLYYLPSDVFVTACLPFWGPLRPVPLKLARGSPRLRVFLHATFLMSHKHAAVRRPNFALRPELPLLFLHHPSLWRLYDQGPDEEKRCG